MEVLITSQTAELRRRAKWYRDMASIGQAELRDRRATLAERLEKMADDLEGEES